MVGYPSNPVKFAQPNYHMPIGSPQYPRVVQAYAPMQAYGPGGYPMPHSGYGAGQVYPGPDLCKTGLWRGRSG